MHQHSLPSPHNQNLVKFAQLLIVTASHKIPEPCNGWIFIWKKKKEKRMQGNFLTVLEPYSLTLGLTLMPKSHGIPYALFTAAVQALSCLPALLRHWISLARSCYSYRKHPCCWERGAVIPARPSLARLPEGSSDGEGACGFPGGPFGSRSCGAPGHRQQLRHDCV